MPFLITFPVRMPGLGSKSPVPFHKRAVPSSNMRERDKMQWTLVTGGAVRLGAEICRVAGRSGRNIAIHYRHSKEQALQLQRELQDYGVYAETIQGDFSTPLSTASFL